MVRVLLRVMQALQIGTAADSMTRMNDKGQVVNNKPVTNAVAIGTGAHANFDNSVAIGGGSNIWITMRQNK